MSTKLPKTGSKTARERKPTKDSKEIKDRSVVINLTIPDSTFRRLDAFRRSMSMLNEHEAIRLGISIMLNNAGY